MQYTVSKVNALANKAKRITMGDVVVGVFAVLYIAVATLHVFGPA